MQERTESQRSKKETVEKEGLLKRVNVIFENSIIQDLTF